MVNEVDPIDKWDNNYAVRNADEQRAQQLSVDVVSTVESSPRAVGTARVCRCIRQGMPGLQVPARRRVTPGHQSARRRACM